MLRGAAVLLLAVSLPVVAASPAGATTITVDTISDLADPTPGDGTCGTGPGTCSLRAAIQTANAIAGPDTISLPAGTYTLSIEGTDEDAAATGDLDVTDDLTITGAGAATTVVDAAGLDRVIDVFDTTSAEPPLQLESMTVAGGAAADVGGGIRSDVGIELDQVDVVGNSASTGAGIYVAESGSGTLLLVDSSVDANISGTWSFTGIYAPDVELVRSSVSDNLGVAIFAGDLTMTDAVVEGNDVDGGWVVLASESMTVLRSSLSNNDGIAAVAGGPVSIIDSTIDGNMAGIAGGLFTAPSVVVSGSSISGNEQFGLHAIDVASLSISDSRIDGNGGPEPNLEAAAGVVVLAPVGTVTITDSSIDGNSAVDGVGGLLVEGGVTTLERTSISGNVGGEVGGASIGDGSVIDSTIAGNAGAWVGGLDGWNVALSSSTVSGNTASDGVGGLEMAGSLSFATVAGNDGTTSDAARFVGDVEVQASVFAGSGPTPLCGGTGVVTSLGSSYATDGSCGLGAGVGDVVGGADPLLAPLADNGGPTWTHLPAIGSPLLEAMPTSSPACTGTDQRGVVRPQASRCDVGAVERELVPAQVFTDIAPAHAIFAETWWGWVRGITGGYADGTFRPVTPLSRQAAMAWLWRSVGSPAPAGAAGFSDVGPDHPFAAAIAWADEQGVSNGYADGTFRSTDPVTRQAMVAWLWQLAGSPAPAAPPSFPDVPAGHPFEDAIGWATEEGIVSGYADGTFRSGTVVSRRAAIVWLHRR